MKKSFSILLLAVILLSSCDRRVYLNDSSKIVITKKQHTSAVKPKRNSNMLLAVLIAIPNIVFFGNQIQNSKGRNGVR